MCDRQGCEADRELQTGVGQTDRGAAEAPSGWCIADLAQAFDRAELTAHAVAAVRGIELVVGSSTTARANSASWPPANADRRKAASSAQGSPDLCPVRGKKLAPPQVSAEVLRKMKKTAEDYLGEEVTKRSSRCRPTSTRAVKFSMPRTVDDRLGRIRCGTPAHRAGRDRYGPPVPPPVGILLHCWFNDACTRPERDSPLAVLAADSWLGGLGVRSIL